MALDRGSRGEGLSPYSPCNPSPSCLQRGAPKGPALCCRGCCLIQALPGSCMRA